MPCRHVSTVWLGQFSRKTGANFSLYVYFASAIQPMVAPPPSPAPATTHDTHRSLTESCVASRDRQMEWSSSQTSGSMWTGQAWSSTPPIPTPALTASSLSSSSLYGERSPILGASGYSNPARRTFDIPSMTSLPPAKSLDGAAPVPLTSNREPLGVQPSQGVGSGPCNNYDASMASLSSSLGALSMSPQQVRGFTGSMDAASMRMGSPLTDPANRRPCSFQCSLPEPGCRSPRWWKHSRRGAQRPLLRIRKRLLLLTSSASGALGK